MLQAFIKRPKMDARCLLGAHAAIIFIFQFRPELLAEIKYVISRLLTDCSTALNSTASVGNVLMWAVG
jgi:hypothetical protein